MLVSEDGSFRDRHNKVYYFEGRVLRGISQEASDNWRNISGQKFFQKIMARGDVVATDFLEQDDKARADILDKGWADALEHKLVPFISYPYEWSFSMLKDAALLHLKLVRKCIENDWTLKDATPYNVQWLASKPVFVDTTSFEPRVEGEPWVGYRQFCMMFLYPLMMKAHMDIDYIPFLRSNLDGIEPSEVKKIFGGSKFLKKGVLSHVVFPARMEQRIAEKERDQAEAKKRSIKHSKNMVLGLLTGLERTVKKLKINIDHTDWSHYETTHSYDDAEHIHKKDFVTKCVGSKKWGTVWDVGSNTGTFAKLCSPHCDTVLAIDGDHNAIEQLYMREKKEQGGNILPLVVNLANISPNQGWAGKERKALDQRRSPDFVICLALIHHMSIAANVPIRMFLGWVRSLNASAIVEFVGRDDAMVKKLLMNKTEDYPDYSMDEFERCVEEMFDIVDRKALKGGQRTVMFLNPK